MLTMLQKPDGSKTTNMTETLKFMLEQVIPEDNAQDDTDHQNVRKLIEQPIETTDDKEFTQDEIRQIIEGLKTQESTRAGRNYK